MAHCNRFVYLNLRMIIEESDIFIESSSSLIWKILVYLLVFYLFFSGIYNLLPLEQDQKKL